MKQKKSFQLELSHHELRWLAGVLGFIQIPMLGSATDAAAEQAEIRKSLLKRGLISDSSGLQVDRVLILLGQLIANPSFMSVVQIFKKDGKGRKAFVYPFHDLPLFIEDAGNLMFTIHAQPDGLILQEMDFLNLPPNNTITNENFSFPADVLSLLLGSSKSAISEKLIKSGLDEDETKRILTSFNQFDGFVVQTFFEWSDGKLSPVDNSCLTWKGENIWVGVLEDREKNLKLSSCNLEQVRSWVINSLRLNDGIKV